MYESYGNSTKKKKPKFIGNRIRVLIPYIQTDINISLSD